MAENKTSADKTACLTRNPMKSFSAQRGMQCEKQNRATEKNSY